MLSDTTWAWIGFHVFVGVLLWLDLKVIHAKSKTFSLRSALGWSAFWIGLGLCFNWGVWTIKGPEAGTQFLTAYLLEKSLSVDNLFVFLLIFRYFKVPSALQHKVLFWGILGALIFRATFILGGLWLIQQFSFLTYILGALLIWGGLRLFRQQEEVFDPGNNKMLRRLRQIMPVLGSFHGDRFFLRRQGILYATPLFIALISIETSDIIFALDSIPAVLAVSQDPFVVYSSNIFAILGLRALFFALAGLLERFHYLDYGLGIVLAFVGIKLILSGWLHISATFTLALVTIVLGGTALLSWRFPPKEEEEVSP
ncbi:MAG: TerC family protein [Bacteroidota bacterium]